MKKTYNIFLVSICMYIVHILYTYIYILLQRVVLFFATYRIDMMTSNDIASENQNFHIIHRNDYYVYQVLQYIICAAFQFKHDFAQTKIDSFHAVFLLNKLP